MLVHSGPAVGGVSYKTDIISRSSMPAFIHLLPFIIIIEEMEPGMWIIFVP